MKVLDIINGLLHQSTNEDDEIKLPNTLSFTNNQNYLYGEELRIIKDKLIECDEFKECDILEFLSMPVVTDKEGKAITVESIVLDNGMKFRGRCFLLSLSLTPIVYNPDDIYKPVKNGVTLTPIMYDAINFMPYRKLILPLPGNFGSSEITNTTIKAELLTLINDVIISPKEYSVTGMRKVIARGIFEHISKDNDDTIKNVDIDLSDPPQWLPVFYMTYKNIEGKNEVETTLGSKLLHITLREKFLKKFEGKSIILEDELNKFLEDNGVINGN